MKKTFSKASSHKVSRQALTILILGTIVVILQLGYIAFDILYGSHVNRLYTIELYRKSMDYILLEVILLVLGAFLFDMTVKDCIGTD